MKKGIRICARLACALLALLFPPLLLSAQTLSEYDVQAAYLYNFGKFVHWPADVSASSSTFDICILGRDPFGGTLDRLIASEQIGGKPIRRRFIPRPTEAQGCAIVYISDSEAPDLRRIVAALSGKGVLLVSGLPHFCEQGGAVQFVMQNDRVRFEVNLDAASANRLAMSSELIRVAVAVMGKPPSGRVP